MGLLALGTYWLARSTPTFAPNAPERPPTHEPDYFVRGFSVKSFDPAGQLKNEIRGVEARHFADTDTMEIDEPRIRSFSPDGAVVVASAKRGISNADGSQVQLIGDAVVTREAAAERRAADPKMEMRGEFLHAYMEQERVISNKPVTLRRGDDTFRGNSLNYDHQKRVLELSGDVRGTLQPKQAAR
ncbi:LPS export ABC transporter periplasmic protein LptC [Ramlibacter monticola]|uniref:LPS export ABC transporter periplasmic protein LptC n=2 Tax=Ramlibacter monticola TaxID=1926872 RepID=A0A937CVP6_9BURK|nr:LPS export ABC transporter periplasmic protein LptC [Ramlibacter monticola]